MSVVQGRMIWCNGLDAEVPDSRWRLINKGKKVRLIMKWE
jgi:hypothetical protein